jgi:hypothetical protein
MGNDEATVLGASLDCGDWATTGNAGMLASAAAKSQRRREIVIGMKIPSGYSLCAGSLSGAHRFSS